MNVIHTSILQNLKNNPKETPINSWKAMMKDNDCCFMYSAYFDTRIDVVGMIRILLTRSGT